MAHPTATWCRGPDCHRLVEWPLAHCSNACERNDREARERAHPKPPKPQTTVAQAYRELADLGDEYAHEDRIATMMLKAAALGADGEMEYRGTRAQEQRGQRNPVRFRDVRSVEDLRRHLQNSIDRE
jgi:hypothetical protein